MGSGRRGTRDAPTISISVALATYNGERFVRDQLRSILNQDAPVDEVVVADDGSTDTTLAIVDEVARANEGPMRVRVVATDRVGGPTLNFERALASCRGDILILCDQDDVWEPTRVSSILPLFPADGVPRAVFSDATLIDGTGSVLPGSLHENLRVGHRERARLRDGRALEVLIRRNVVTGAATAVSRELYELAVPFPETWVHDEWLAILAASMGDITMLDERLVRYRLHGANQIGVADPDATSRLRRMMLPRGDRLARLLARSVELATRLDALDAPSTTRDLARSKAAFEARRALYPASRISRVPAVLRELARGSYPRFASQRRIDAVRDVLQPE